MEVMCFGLGVGHDVWEEVYLSSCKSCGVADIAAAAVFVMRDSQESVSILRSRDGTKKTAERPPPFPGFPLHLLPLSPRGP